MYTVHMLHAKSCQQGTSLSTILIYVNFQINDTSEEIRTFLNEHIVQVFPFSFISLFCICKRILLWDYRKTQTEKYIQLKLNRRDGPVSNEYDDYFV